MAKLLRTWNTANPPPWQYHDFNMLFVTLTCYKSASYTHLFSLSLSFSLSLFLSLNLANSLESPPPASYAGKCSQDWAIKAPGEHQCPVASSAACTPSYKGKSTSLPEVAASAACKRPCRPKADQTAQPDGSAAPRQPARYDNAATTLSKRNLKFEFNLTLCSSRTQHDGYQAFTE